MLLFFGEPVLSELDMKEWWLIGLLVLIAVSVCVFLVYPMRRERKTVVIVFPLLLGFALSGYMLWGSYESFARYLHQEENRRLAKKMLKSLEGPDALIQQLKAKLDANPKSAKGWYLLGKLYLRQGKKKESLNAFALAHQLQPEEEEYSVYYAHGLWVKNNQEFNPEIRNLFLKLLSKNPNQPDALAMLAMDAYTNQSYENAIQYWQRLLRLATPQSNEALSIRKAIAKAQAQIGKKVNLQ